MTAITRSLLSAGALMLEWDGIDNCTSEDALRTALMGAFLHVKETHLSFVLMPEATPPVGYDKRLDLYLLPSWPPQQQPVAAGEVKFFPANRPTDYRTRVGARLSDVHYVHSLAHSEGLHGFFFDIVLDPKLVGQKCYASLKSMCKIASDALYDSVNPLPQNKLSDIKGVKAFATACMNRTPGKLLHKMQYGFLFPPMDLPGGPGRTKRGQAFVKQPNQDRLIEIGVRKSGNEQKIPYRTFKTKNQTQAAVCFAVFEPGGVLGANTDDLIAAATKW